MACKVAMIASSVVLPDPGAVLSAVSGALVPVSKGGNGFFIDKKALCFD
jgi:hypothetical protein